MSSSQSLRDFIRERLTAAADEIFTEFDKTIVHYEEELDRQRRLLETPNKAAENRHYTKSLVNHGCDSLRRMDFSSEPIVAEIQDFLQPCAWKEQVNLTDHQLYYQTRSCSVDQNRPGPQQITKNPVKKEPARIKKQPEILEPLQNDWGEPEPLLIKEDLKKAELQHQQVKEEPEPLQIKVKQEETELQDMKVERAVPEPPQINDEHEPQPPQIKNEQEDLCVGLEKEQLEFKHQTDTCTVNTTDEEKDLLEPDTNRKFILLTSSESENQNQEMGNHEDLGLSSNEELNQSKSFQKTRDRGEDVDNPNQKKKGQTYRNDNFLSCKCCGKLLARTYLSEHMRIHTGERLFSCTTCGKKFITGSKLKIHIRTHTGEKPFSCKTCDKCFSDRGNLSKHMKIHSGERPFSCLTCGKGFSNRGNLFQHARTHLGEKPFSCLTCGKGFTRKVHLKDHMRIHTREKQFSCTNGQ